ncbi:MAG: IclR family transcriptional regulator [Ruminococcaceae bacterium]|nr:IclR family transcriptional regulator [Oscillospiraceae bacterium]
MAQKNNQSVERAFLILEAIADNEGIGVSDIAREVALNKSTAFGIIKTLDNLGYIFKDETTDKYHSSFKLKELGEKGSAGIGILEFARPYLEQLSKKYGEIIHFVQAEEDVVLYIDKIESTKSIRVHTGIGGMMPLYCTGVGKAILATRSKEEIMNYLNKTKLEKYTENTITAKGDLSKEIFETKKRGYAIDNGENHEDLYCLAVAIHNKQGQGSHAVSISLPLFRKDNYNLDEMIDDLKKVRNKIEKYF